MARSRLSARVTTVTCSTICNILKTPLFKNATTLALDSPFSMRSFNTACGHLIWKVEKYVLHAGQANMCLA
jgi:hypothetical protein